MSRFAPAVSDYWRSVLDDDVVVMADGGSTLRISDGLDHARAAMILERIDGRTSVALAAALAARIDAGDARRISMPLLRQRLADVGVALHEPDLLFYLPTHPTSAPSADLSPESRRLTNADRDTFHAFQAEASEQDLEDAYVELDHWAVFGAFDGDRLVSVASAYPWDAAAIVDLGVLTLPDARGKGYGRATVQALSGFAREQGFEPQYRCQTDNQASIALAMACGFQLFGRWEVIRRDTDGA